MKTPWVVALVALAGLQFACSTVQSRIEEHPAEFSSLDPALQEKIKRGEIDIGFTTDMVYMALGRPTEQRESVNSTGRSSVWTYSTYYERYEGAAFVGYRREFVFNPRTQSYVPVYEPMQRDVYSEQKEDLIHVTFKNGRVSNMEQLKR